MDIETTYRILNEAVLEHNPSILIACFSGGYDSMVMTHIVNQWIKDEECPIPLLVAAVDTGISADGWRSYVSWAAQMMDVKRFEIWGNDLQKWRDDVLERGFVYRKAQHPFYFYYLKQRAFRSMVAQFKTHTHDRVMFLNGIRRAESIERRKAPEVERKGSGVFVNPILYWSNLEVAQYRIDNGLPLNPFYDRTHNSGDCLCNWHNHISLSDIQQWGKEAWKIIEPLHQHNIDAFGYGYDEEPPESIKLDAAGQLRLFDWDTDCTPNLCVGCNKPEPGNDTLDFVTLQRMDW